MLTLDPSVKKQKRGDNFYALLSSVAQKKVCVINMKSTVILILDQDGRQSFPKMALNNNSIEMRGFKSVILKY